MRALTSKPAAVTLCLLLLAVASFAASDGRSLDRGTNELGFWAGYSPNNPTLIGITTDRPFTELNFQYARVIVARDHWALKYTIEMVPLAAHQPTAAGQRGAGNQRGAGRRPRHSAHNLRRRHFSHRAASEFSPPSCAPALYQWHSGRPVFCRAGSRERIIAIQLRGRLGSGCADLAPGEPVRQHRLQISPHFQRQLSRPKPGRRLQSVLRGIRLELETLTNPLGVRNLKKIGGPHLPVFG